MKKILHWIWHNVVAFGAHAFAAFALMLVLAALKAVKDNLTFAEVLSNWKDLISPAIITILLSALVGLFLVNLRQRNTLASFGVRLFSHHDNIETKKRDWTGVSNDIGAASPERATLRMLGATGKETFSGATSPLFDVLKKYDGEIKVLLIRPHSGAFISRCKSLRISTDSYLEEILDSIEYCKTLAQLHNRAIELKLYDHVPVWKMLIISKTLWVQYYKATEHVDNTPMYCFEFKGQGTTLFDGFRSVFEKRWALDGSKSIDLAKFVRADWERHCT
jgi:uncharacterized integral membrane protein